jgi:DNA-binding MarR family transcriptional regulator
MLCNYKIAAVARFIAANPECSRVDIARATRIRIATVGCILQSLKRNNVIRMEGDRRGARYYALTLEERIALVIKNNPLSKRSDIAAATGLDLHVVGRKLNTLCREKKIRMRGDRRGARYVSC